MKTICNRGLPGIWLALGIALMAYGIMAADPATSTTTPVRKTSPPLALPPVEFNNPPRQYFTNQVRGWPIFIEQELVQKDPVLARAAWLRLEGKLDQALKILPNSTKEQLQHLRFFVMYGEQSKRGGRNNGLEYFQKTAPYHRSHLDPRMASSIVIYSATNFIWLTEFWALKALVHELAHAHHLEQWTESRVDIYDAWDHAKETGLYRNVLNNHGRILLQSYALQNHLEYFAELSCIYFVNGDYYPFNRTELGRYDPQGYALIENLWGLEKSLQKAQPLGKR